MIVTSRFADFADIVMLCWCCPSETGRSFEFRQHATSTVRVIEGHQPAQVFLLRFTDTQWSLCQGSPRVTGHFTEVYLQAVVVVLRFAITTGHCIEFHSTAQKCGKGEVFLCYIPG